MTATATTFNAAVAVSLLLALNRQAAKTRKSERTP